jgi:hypothetical protein
MTTTDELRARLRLALKADFNRLYVRRFTTDWETQRLIRGVEIDVMDTTSLERLIHSEVNAALERVKGKVERKVALRATEDIAHGWNSCHDAFTKAIEGEKR